jgi:hypothetical protein
MSTQYVYAIHFKSVSHGANVKESFTGNLLVVPFIGTTDKTVEKFCATGPA